MSDPRISVIIPAFNCARWVCQAIDSVLNQSIPPHEIIVVDDGSTDDTAKALAGYGDRIKLIFQPNQGVAAARNTGLRVTEGEFIAFLDADDIWHPKKLELQLRTLIANPSIGLLGTGMFVWPIPDMPDVTLDRLSSVKPIGRDELAVKNYLATSSLMIRREVVRKIGEFDVSLCGPEDHDYWLRAAEFAGVAILQVQLTGYRSVAGSLSKRAVTMEAGMQRILAKLDSRDFWRGNLWLRRRAYGYANYSCAYLYGASGKQWTSICRLFSSVAWYPLPYRRSEVSVSFGRTRRFGVCLLRLVGAVRPDSGI